MKKNYQLKWSGYKKILEKHFAMIKCHLCGVREGQLHKLGCMLENCPICEYRLIECDRHCLTVKKTGIYFKKEFESYKRIPFIKTGNYCRRCLVYGPEMFKVPGEEWNKMPASLKEEMLCWECYNKIIEWVDKKASKVSKPMAGTFLTTLTPNKIIYDKDKRPYKFIEGEIRMESEKH